MTDTQVQEKENKEETINKKSGEHGAMEDFIEKIESMSVLELSELVKALEDKFGVTAAAPVAVAGVAAGGDAGAAEAAVEQTEFSVELSSIGDKKIQVIKEVRAITSLGLKEAKDLVESAPKMVKEGIEKEEAEKFKAQLEKAGATAAVK